MFENPVDIQALAEQSECSVDLGAPKSVCVCDSCGDY